jgi:hypothetical protein
MFSRIVNSGFLFVAAIAFSLPAAARSLLCHEMTHGERFKQAATVVVVKVAERLVSADGTRLDLVMDVVKVYKGNPGKAITGYKEDSFGDYRTGTELPVHQQTVLFLPLGRQPFDLSGCYGYFAVPTAAQLEQLAAQGTAKASEQGKVTDRVGALLAGGKYAEAIAAAELVVPDDDTTALKLLTVIGVARLLLGEPDIALSFFNSVLARNPASVEASYQALCAHAVKKDSWAYVELFRKFNTSLGVKSAERKRYRELLARDPLLAHFRSDKDYSRLMAEFGQVK